MHRMNSIFALSLVLVAFISTSASSQTLVGKWKGDDGKEVGFMTFDAEGYVSFTVEGEAVGGKDYQAEGIIFDMFYETDESVKPQTIDFVIRMKDQTEIARMMGIYAMPDDQTLIINMKFDGSARPTLLDETSEDQISLTKMTEEETSGKKPKKKKKSGIEG